MKISSLLSLLLTFALAGSALGMGPTHFTYHDYASKTAKASYVMQFELDQTAIQLLEKAAEPVYLVPRSCLWSVNLPYGALNEEHVLVNGRYSTNDMLFTCNPKNGSVKLNSKTGDLAPALALYCGGVLLMPTECLSKHTLKLQNLPSQEDMALSAFVRDTGLCLPRINFNFSQKGRKLKCKETYRFANATYKVSGTADPSSGHVKLSVKASKTYDSLVFIEKESVEHDYSFSIESSDGGSVFPNHLNKQQVEVSFYNYAYDNGYQLQINGGGYLFPSEDSFVVDMETNTTVKVIFPRHSCDLDIVGEGKCDAYYLSPTTLHLSATPGTGYVFSHYEIDGEWCEIPQLEVKLDGPCYIVAYFYEED